MSPLHLTNEVEHCFQDRGMVTTSGSGNEAWCPVEEKVSLNGGNEVGIENCHIIESETKQSSEV